MDQEIRNPLLEREKSYYDLEHDSKELEDMGVTIRNGFIRKIFGLLIYQILVIISVTTVFNVFPQAKIFLLSHYTLVYLTLATVIPILFLPFCFPEIFKTIPLNYIILTILDGGIGLCIAVFCSNFSLNSVYFFLTLVFIIFTALCIYVSFIKTDFTMWKSFIFISIVIFIFSPLLLIFFSIGFLALILNTIILLIFSLYLIYDVLVSINKLNNIIGSDEYMLANMNLFTDIFYLLYNIPQFCGCCPNDQSNNLIRNNSSFFIPRNNSTYFMNQK